MSKESRITLLVSFATIFTLFFGYVSSQSDENNIELLKTEIELGREYVDLILVERLTPIVRKDKELRLIKEELVNTLTKRKQNITEKSAIYSRSSMLLLMSLILIQLSIVLITVPASMGKVNKYAVCSMLGIVVITSSIAVLLLTGSIEL